MRTVVAFGGEFRELSRFSTALVSARKGGWGCWGGLGGFYIPENKRLELKRKDTQIEKEKKSFEPNHLHFFGGF